MGKWFTGLVQPATTNAGDKESFRGASGSVIAISSYFDVFTTRIVLYK